MTSILFFNLNGYELISIMLIQIIMMISGYTIASNFGKRKVKVEDTMAILLLGSMITLLVSMVLVTIANATESNIFVGLLWILSIVLLSGFSMFIMKVIFNVMKYKVND